MVGIENLSEGRMKRGYKVAFYSRPFGYCFYGFLFITSFAFGEGELNEMRYAKQFACGIAFLAMLLLSIFKTGRKKAVTIGFSPGDMLSISLMVIYLYFYRGTNNDLDFALPLIYFLFYIFCRLEGPDRLDDPFIILSRLASVTILCHVLICLFQWLHILPSLHPYFPVGSTFGNPDMLGAYLAFLLPLSYLRPARLNWVLALVVLVLLILIQARTAIVATILTGVLYLFRTGRISAKHLKGAVLPSVVLLGLLVWWHPASVVGRLFIWMVALGMMISKPLGWGLHSFEKYYLECQSEYLLSHPETTRIFNTDVVHSPFNEFLNIGVTFGLIGFLCFTALLLYILTLSYKAKSPLVYPFCTFLILSIFYFPFLLSPLALLFILTCASIINIHSVRILWRLNIPGRLIIYIPMIVIVFFFFVSSYRHYHTWKYAVELSGRESQYAKADILFSKLYPDLKGNGRFLITNANLRYKQGDINGALVLMEEAQQSFTDPAFLQNMALLYEETGDYVKAEERFSAAIHMVPEGFSIPYERILFFLRIGENRKAYQYALELYSKPILSSYYTDPYIIKGELDKIIQTYQPPNE